MRVLCLGATGAGKTSIINRLKFGADAPAAHTGQPTRGFNVTSIDYSAQRYTVWEVGGDNLASGAWRQYT